MTKALTRLRLLVSCSSELQAERGLLEKVVEDVNRIVEDAYGVSSSTIDWKRDIVPGAGLATSTRDQFASNGLRDLLWDAGDTIWDADSQSRFWNRGELQRCLPAFPENPRSVRLLFYFRTASAGGVMDIDPEQLRRVQSFDPVWGERPACCIATSLRGRSSSSCASSSNPA